MHKLTQEEAISKLNNLLQEDISETFQKQLTIASEHGDPSFFVHNRNGEEIEVAVDWDKEADQLSYFIIN